MIVVDPWHWLHPDGSLPEAPTLLRTRAHAMAQCIEYGGPLPVHCGRETLLRCRRRPGGRQCGGFLWVVKTQSQEIHAFCPACGSDEFLIHNWEETPWATGPMDPLPLEEMSASDVVIPPGLQHSQHFPGPGDIPTLRQRIATALHLLKAPLQVITVFEMIDRADQLSEVISSVMQHADVSDVVMVREFLQILMDAWQLKQHGFRLSTLSETAVPSETATAGFGGAVEEVATVAAPTVLSVFDQPAFERSCSCGSGKPRARCCLLN